MVETKYTKCICDCGCENEAQVKDWMCSGCSDHSGHKTEIVSGKA